MKRPWGCFMHAQDALCDVSDALLTADGARSFADLALAPSFQRQWPSLYDALDRGRIDDDTLRRWFAGLVPVPGAGERLLLAADTRPYPRPEAAPAEDRTIVYAGTDAGGQAQLTAGWSYRAVVALPPASSSGGTVLDHRRVPSDSTPTKPRVAQRRDLRPLVPVRPVVDLDRGYGHVPFLAATTDLACDFLGRISRHRVCYRPAPPRTPDRRGAPRQDGDRCKGRDPATHGPPDRTWLGFTAHGTLLRVSCWTNLPLRTPRDRPLTVVRVVRRGAKGTKRDPRGSWYWWLADTPAPLPQIARRFAPGRYSIEHRYRFRKQALLWTTPRPRTPAQADRWTSGGGHRPKYPAGGAVSRCHPAAPVGIDHPCDHPWPGAAGDGGECGQVGPLARPPQPRGKSPGRAVGTPVPRAPRYPVVRKPHRRAQKARAPA